MESDPQGQGDEDRGQQTMLNIIIENKKEKDKYDPESVSSSLWKKRNLVQHLRDVCITSRGTAAINRVRAVRKRKRAHRVHLGLIPEGDKLFIWCWQEEKGSSRTEQSVAAEDRG